MKEEASIVEKKLELEKRLETVKSALEVTQLAAAKKASKAGSCVQPTPFLKDMA